MIGLYRNVCATLISCCFTSTSVYFNNIKSILFSETDYTNEDRVTDFENLPNVIGKKEFDIIKSFEKRLTNIPKTQIRNVIADLNEHLNSCNIRINLYILQKKENYSYTLLNDGQGKQHKTVRKIPISFIQPIFIGSNEILNDITDGSIELKILNLVAVPGTKENDILYTKDLSKFYRCLLFRPTQKKYNLRKIFLCNKCGQSYIEKRNYESHIKKCAGTGNTTFKFTSDVITYEENVSKMNVHPVDLYYDLETTNGTGANMKVISYSLSLSFNSKMNIPNSYIYRSLVQTEDELMQYSLREFIFRYRDKTDIKLIKRSIKRIKKREELAMSHHLTLEIKLLIKWVRKYLQQSVLPCNRTLSNNDKFKYRKENPQIDKCCICQFPIEIDANKIPNSDKIKFEIKKEFMRTYNAVSDLKMTEEEYIEKIFKAVENLYICSGIRNLKLRCSGNLNCVQLLEPKIGNYLKEVNCNSIQEFEELVDKNIIENNESWEAKFIFFEYRRCIERNYPLSSFFIDGISNCLKTN